MQFAGFSPGTQYTPVPDPLLGPLLEQIRDLAELKVTLRGLWLLHRKRGFPRALPLTELLNDGVLLRGLSVPGGDPREEIRRGLRLAVARKTLLLYQPDPGPPEQQSYLLNTDSDRRALARMQQGGDLPPRDDLWLAEVPMETSAEDRSFDRAQDKPFDSAQDKSNIFALYEENVGLLSPIMVEKLKEAEEAYPWPWVQEAFTIAVTHNKRSWHYISGILRRWAAEGKDHGEPGRYSKEGDRQKYLQDYQRRWGRSSGQRADG
jgi:DnaD/phage-associated family protein